ncbi:MAG TPA: M1 family aminopeptidase [Pyrinomonadaceae bacterium]|nr:M1 family aminopeptidase [Pyrinomonadaceae bacterium]
MLTRVFLVICFCAVGLYAQTPPIEPGVSQELAKWRAAHYSDVRYKLNLTLEKMSPVLKGTMEIRVGVRTLLSASAPGAEIPPIILDWRRIKGHEAKSVISNVEINGVVVSPPSGDADMSVRTPIEEHNEHLIFRDGVKLGENIIKLDFTSPILASGSAITRYIDKEDGSEYIYSLFVPSDASTAFPVFDQPDLKARFQVNITAPDGWNVVSNSLARDRDTAWSFGAGRAVGPYVFAETKPISTYVFAFAAGPFERVSEPPAVAGGLTRSTTNADRTKTASVNANSTDANGQPPATAGGSDRNADTTASIYVRRSQAAKFQPHAAEVFRLNRESIKYFEEYFDYKFPFPKYDLVLIPEFPFGGMEHAGATFLRESAIIFPQEPTKSDHISRAVLIFHEAAHQWFGDTVTMKWFDDLWLKEGFANFMAYKALERIMPEANAWKVFYERIKQPAYATDSTRGTTPIYQPIDNLNSAKSAYGNIVYNKAPAFLKQAEFYLGPEKFQTAVRSFLKKHEFKNAKWEDLVKEFEAASGHKLGEWANNWVKKRGVPIIKLDVTSVMRDGRLEPVRFHGNYSYTVDTQFPIEPSQLNEQFQAVVIDNDGKRASYTTSTCSEPKYRPNKSTGCQLLFAEHKNNLFWRDLPQAILPNYQDYGYGIFLLDDKSREYVLKNVQNEKDAFLRSMMYGALWDSVREGELDPRAYVEVAIRNLPTEQDETIAQMMLNRTAAALTFYVNDEGRNLSGSEGAPRATSSDSRTLPTGRVSASIAAFENILIDRMQNATTNGQRITYFRALVANATTERSRGVLKAMLAEGRNLSGSEGAPQQTSTPKGTLPTGRVSALTLRTKDKFDIVTRLAVLNDPEAAKLLAELEKTETSDDAKRYAYAARAAFPTKENREKFWNDFVNNKDISESWIEAAFGPFNAVRNSELSLPYLKRALEELPNHKRSRKIFFVNGWLAAFIGGQRSQEALDILNKFLADNPNLDRDLRLKILENVDRIERSVRIRGKNK